MKNLKCLDAFRVDGPMPQTETSGCFQFYLKGTVLFVVASIDHDNGVDFDHVSVTCANQKRCPTWEEMCAVKDRFFDPEEDCLQLHPKRSQYANLHPYCLHIWRPHGFDWEMNRFCEKEDVQ